MYKFGIMLFSTLGIIYSQCDNLLELQCAENLNCDWIEDMSYGNCGNLAWQVCENYSGCYVDSNPGWYDNSGPYCAGGTYQLDNSYCEEVELPECSEMNAVECNNNGSCAWIEDIEIINCSTLSTSGWGPGSCEYYYPDCYNYLDYGGWYGSWSTECGGGTAQIDNSFCEEVSFIPGDVNGDGSLNISDIILIVDLILSSDYNQYSDLNQDGILNITDIIELVNKILNS